MSPKFNKNCLFILQTITFMINYIFPTSQIQNISMRIPTFQMQNISMGIPSYFDLNSEISQVKFISDKS